MTSPSLTLTLLVVLPIFSWCILPAVGTTLSLANLNGLKSQFQTGLKSTADLPSLHYSLAGAKELGTQSPETFCNDIKKLVDKSNAESIYHATEAAKTLNTCKLSAEDFRSTVSSTIQSDKSTTAEIYYAVHASINLGLSVDASAVEKRLNALAKTDDSILSQGYALLTAAQLSSAIAKTYADTINDLVQQADEVDGHLLQYEGGISTTALVFNAFYEVAEKAGAPVKIDPKQLVKFANYFSTKRHVATLRSAYYLTKAFKYLSNNKNTVAVVVSRLSSSEVNAQNPSVVVSVTNLLGQSVGEMTVTAESAKRKEDGVVVVSKQKLTSKSSDFTVYELSFFDKKIPRGFYTIHLTLTPRTNGDFVGLTDNTINVKVTSEAVLENAELSVADRDNAAQVKTFKLTYPTALSGNVEVDYHQKLIVKFQVKAKQTDEFLRVQQAFLRLANKKSNKEVIYLAEAATGADAQYKVEVDLTTNANDFLHQSGAYEVALLVGDASLQTGFSWKLTDNLQLSFHEDNVPDTDHLNLYSAKPEIVHQFREDEKRPPATVSLVFSALTALPLLILLILWFTIGANFSGLPLGLSPLGFHISHGAVFALMYFYWKYLDMFQTMRYLALVSIPLFLFGHRLLATLAARREKKA